jgi:general stress protein YciG
MITRITKSEADKRIAAQTVPRDDKYGEPGEVMVIGYGRFYFQDKNTTSKELNLFLAEWQESKNGAELPSFPKPEMAHHNPGNFANNPELAKRAGRIGGSKSPGNFKNNPAAAQAAGRLGGRGRKKISA